MGKKKTYEIIKVLVRPSKYPYTIQSISFEMIDDGSQVDAVKTLMSHMGVNIEDWFFDNKISKEVLTAYENPTKSKEIGKD